MQRRAGISNSNKDIVSQAKSQDLITNKRYFAQDPKRKKTPTLKGKGYTESTQKEKLIQNSQMSDNEDEEQEENEIEIVEGDDEGEDCHKEPEKRASKKRKARSTDVQKSNNLFVVDPYGEEFRAVDGLVKLNPSKFIMKKLTPKEVEAFNKKDSSLQLTADHYECILYTRVANDHKHQRFIKAAKSLHKIAPSEFRKNCS